LSLDDLHERVTTDPRAANLWADTLAVAAETEDDRKRVAMARVLRLGLFREDDAEIDPERFYLRAIAPLETAHLLILDLMRHPQEMKDGGRIRVGTPWGRDRLTEFRPQLAPVLDLLMTQMETWGLVVDDQPASTRQPSNASWRVTGFGEKVYKFLEQTPADN
jgi:hypothetical protein